MASRRVPPSMDLYVDDFLAGTIGMTPAARGIYLSLIMYQWNHGSVPNPRGEDGKPNGFQMVSERFFCGIAGATPEELKEHLPEVLNKFEEDENGNLINRRTASERARKMEIYEKRRAAGRKGGRPKANGLANGKANENQMVKQSLTISEVEVCKRSNKKKEDECLSVEDCLKVEIPRPLNVKEFRDAWREWVAYKQETSHAWKSERGVKAQLTRLAKHDREAAIAGIWNAISEEWQGVYPERITARANGSEPHQVPEPQRPKALTADQARFQLIRVMGVNDARGWSDDQCLAEYRTRMTRTA